MLKHDYSKAENNYLFPHPFELSTLNGTNGFVVTPQPNLGYTSMSGVGDINGDGLDDMMIGISSTLAVGGNIGYLLYGSENAFPASIDLSYFDGVNGFSYNLIR